MIKILFVSKNDEKHDWFTFIFNNLIIMRHVLYKLAMLTMLVMLLCSELSHAQGGPRRRRRPKPQGTYQ